MLLTITTDYHPATDLGYLLHKHPDRFQSFSMSFGRAHVFYPQATEQSCKACLLLEVDPVGLVRKQSNRQSGLLRQYVNDRPYVASSFMSVAISRVFGTAMSGHCKDRPELVQTAIPLVVEIEVLLVRGGEEFLRRVFEPLGYEVQVERYPLDSHFSEWGESQYFSVRLQAKKTLSELLVHLYVLIPVFDNEKHYFVGEDELEKLLEKGQGWLSTHPEKEQITRRYLKNQSGLYRQAIARLVEEESNAGDADTASGSPECNGEQLVSLHQQRLDRVMETLRSTDATSVIDLGCGEGKLLQQLMRERQFERVVGMDVSIRSLEKAEQRLKIARLPDQQASRIQLIHGSLMYRDERLRGFQAAALVEVIEHLDPPRLAALERVVFEFARPDVLVLTTPNRDYNAFWPSLPAGQFRHTDHRFEWSRAEFQLWAQRVAEKHNYQVEFFSVGPEEAELGAPTQMGVFKNQVKA